jgi:hypothetical protein
MTRYCSLRISLARTPKAAAAWVLATLIDYGIVMYELFVCELTDGNFCLHRARREETDTRLVDRLLRQRRKRRTTSFTGACAACGDSAHRRCRRLTSATRALCRVCVLLVLMMMMMIF